MTEKSIPYVEQEDELDKLPANPAIPSGTGDASDASSETKVALKSINVGCSFPRNSRTSSVEPLRRLPFAPLTRYIN